MSFAPIEREPATIEIAPSSRPDTMGRLQAGNADEAAAFAATKSTRSVRRVTPRGVRSDGATRRLVERLGFVRSLAAGSVASADNLCQVIDTSGCGGNSQRVMKEPGGDGAR